MTSGSVIRQAWMRSSGRCECRRSSHRHTPLRCGAPLFWGHRGNRMLLGGWEVLHTETGRWGVIADYEILCCECYKAATTMAPCGAEPIAHAKRSS